jgi:hypothetical protein
MPKSAEHQDVSGSSAAPETSGRLHVPPPGQDLERFLSLITPPGALTWQALHGELPWTDPPGSWLGHSRPSEGELRRILAANGVTDQPGQWYVIHGPYTEVMVESPRSLDRNLGHAARSLAVAAEVDICGGELTDLSRVLDLTDHEHGGDPRSARRYLSRGRRLFAALGVWPWANIARWPRRAWWQEPDVIRGLATWQDRAWSRTAQKLVASVRARNGRASVNAINPVEFDAVRVFRAALDNPEAPPG